MSDYSWDVPGEPQQKLTLDTLAWRGSFVVLKYDQTPVPDWAKDNVIYYETHSTQWVTPSGATTKRPSQKASKSKPEARKKRIYPVQACRMWLHAGPPRPNGANPDVSTRMLILDLVFSRQLFDCPCLVNEFFIACNGYDLGEDEEWSDLIQYQLRDMTNSEKQEIGIPVESPAPTPIAATDIIEAVRTEGQATRETVTGGFRGLLEKVGLIRKRASWPRVSLKGRKRAADLWRAWPGVCLDAGRGGEKVDCYEYHEKELSGLKIASVEHFKAVLDAARKL
jgi:hypothetical protein